MNETLYFIANEGCDDTTHGLVWLTDEDFSKFKTFVENLNRNSNCGCMPTISVYKVSMDYFREFAYNPDLRRRDEGYVDKDYIFYLDDKTYTFADTDSIWSHYDKWERVIWGGTFYE